MILVIDSNEVFGNCVLDILSKHKIEAKLYNNAIRAMDLVAAEVPSLIFLDPMLTGPDGFTFLNEMASYADTMKVPIVLVAEKDFSNFDLLEYNIVGFLNKNKLKPEEVMAYVREYA